MKGKILFWAGYAITYAAGLIGFLMFLAIDIAVTKILIARAFPVLMAGSETELLPGWVAIVFIVGTWIIVHLLLIMGVIMHISEGYTRAKRRQPLDERGKKINESLDRFMVTYDNLKKEMAELEARKKREEAALKANQQSNSRT